MNRLVLFLILVATTVDYLARVGLLPRLAKYTPELLSALVLICVVVLGVRDRFRFVRPAYWFTFGAVAIVMLCGALANGLESGPLFAGLRGYLRAMPLFFLPAVYAFSERQVRGQLWLLLVICLVQIPLAFEQRMTTMAGEGSTGDATSGTLLLSGVLSVFLIAAVCVLTAAFLKKRIGIVLFLPLFILLLVPTMLNETKATVLFLPVALLITFLAGSRRGTRFGHAVIAMCVLGIFGSIFIPVYDYYVSHREHAAPLMEFFADKSRLERYLSRDADVGATQAARGDALLVPLREMSRDPVHFAFGTGIGNASKSSLGEQFNGEYFRKYEPFLRSAASVFILEIGVLGLLLALFVNYLIFRDSRAVAEADPGLIGVLAAGWAGIAILIAMATFYVDVPTSVALSYLFWYYSGLIAAHRVRLSERPA